MAYSEALAARIRAEMSGVDGVIEKKMFGGLAFLVHGNMCVGVNGDRLCARVGKDAYAVLSEEPGARPMDFTGRPLRGFLFVDAEAVTDDAVLQTWIGRCRSFVDTLPRK